MTRYARAAKGGSVGGEGLLTAPPGKRFFVPASPTLMQCLSHSRWRDALVVCSMSSCAHSAMLGRTALLKMRSSSCLFIKPALVRSQVASEPLKTNWSGVQGSLRLPSIGARSLSKHWYASSVVLATSRANM